MNDDNSHNSHYDRANHFPSHDRVNLGTGGRAILGYI